MKIVVDVLKRCKEHLLIYLLFFMPGTWGPGIFSGKEFNQPHFLLSVSFVSLVKIALLHHLVQRREDLASLGWTPFRPSHVAWGFAGGASLLLLAGILYRVLDLSPSRVIPWQFDNYPMLPLLVVALGTGAFLEEFFFRGYLLHGFLSAEIPPMVAAGITTAAFSMAHSYQGAGATLLSFLLGGVLLSLRVGTRSLWPPTLSHFLYNFSALLIGSALSGR